MGFHVSSWESNFTEVLGSRFQSPKFDGSTSDLKSLKEAVCQRPSGGVIVPPQVDARWGILGSYCNIPKAIFYLHTVHYDLLSILEPPESFP